MVFQFAVVQKAASAEDGEADDEILLGIGGQGVGGFPAFLGPEGDVAAQQPIHGLP